MHRSRPFVLVILAAGAACSKHDPSEGNDMLSQDRTLAAQLNDRASRQPALPVACGTITVAAAPSAANQQQADELTRQAGVAEMHGNIDSARSLLNHASALDGTNKSAAYHLGRTSEALGDRTTALTSYCRYLALAPTAAESVEARQRVNDLSRSMPRATAGVSDSVAARGGVAVSTSRQPVRQHSSVGSRVVASAAAPGSSSARSSRSVMGSPGVISSGSAQPQTAPPQTTQTPAPGTSTDVGSTGGSVTASGDVVETRSQAPATDPSPTPPRAQRRGSIGVQSAIIGAAAGAILGAATGRSVKSTVIGAAAGGVFGTVVGTTTRPPRRSIRS